jgi:rubrerythrin
MQESTKMTQGTSINRTGMSTSAHAKAMEEVPGMTHPARYDGELGRARAVYLKETHALGTIPPPTTFKGAAKAAAQLLKGNKAIALVDKMAERLAFERTGVRLYDALIEKLAVSGSFEGGPSHDELVTIRDEELAHAHMLVGTLEALGADPTAVTPSADLAGMEAQGIGSVLSDPRTTVGQGLHALLVAELADHENWTLLRGLAEDMDQDDLARAMQQAEKDEERHLERVRAWVKAYAKEQAELL